MIGIDVDARLFYEGRSFRGHAVWPSPVISTATLLTPEQDHSCIPESTDLGLAKLVFREDQFDPVTRIRRGRFYKRDESSQPQDWFVQPHPAIPRELSIQEHHGAFRKSLFGFHDWSARHHLSRPDVGVIVVLGVQHAMTLWRIIGIEQISTGEDLVTLKARANLGVLPELSPDKVPEAGRERVLQSVEKLVDTAYRAGPESVIDRSRDLAAAVLGAFFESTDAKAPHRDLGELAEMAAEDKRFITANAARILALLHARVKPNEQSRRRIPAPMESDATLALECAAAILREVGWVT